MKHVHNNGHIYKPLMAGLFAGYFATILCIVYDVVFRQYTHFPLHELVNVSTLIFGVLIILPLAGCLFAFVDIFFKRSTLVYEMLSAVILLLLVYGIFHIQRSSNPSFNLEFKYLILGVTLITGAAIFSVPYFIKHSSIFMED